MITPTHAVYNLALLGRRGHPERTWPVLLGAFVPDLPGTFCLLYCHFIQGDSIRQIQTVIYPSAFWQTWADWFHSIPVALCGLLLFRLLKWFPGFWFCASLALHSLEDIPVHATNPHRHFLPLSDYRFYSPVSCYDSHFHVILIAPLDFALALLCVWLIWRRGVPLTGKIALGLALGLEAGHSVWAVLKG
jgi:hypothetical protein